MNGYRDFDFDSILLLQTFPHAETGTERLKTEINKVKR